MYPEGDVGNTSVKANDLTGSAETRDLQDLSEVQTELLPQEQSSLV